MNWLRHAYIRLSAPSLVLGVLLSSIWLASIFGERDVVLAEDRKPGQGITSLVLSPADNDLWLWRAPDDFREQLSGETRYRRFGVWIFGYIGFYFPNGETASALIVRLWFLDAVLLLGASPSLVRLSRYLRKTSQARATASALSMLLAVGFLRMYVISLWHFGFRAASDPLAFGRPTVPYWFLAAIFAAPPLLWFRHFRRQRNRTRSGRCLVCGYDLRASRERCPECGTIASAVLPPPT